MKSPIGGNSQKYNEEESKDDDQIDDEVENSFKDDEDGEGIQDFYGESTFKQDKSKMEKQK